MNEKSRDSKRSLSGEIDRADAQGIQPEAYEKIPELTDDSVERGQWFVAATEVAPQEGKAAFRKALKRGSPKASATKISTTIRLDAEVLEAFKATGHGWQTHLNQVLRDWVKNTPGRE